MNYSRVNRYGFMILWMVLIITITALLYFSKDRWGAGNIRINYESDKGQGLNFRSDKNTVLKRIILSANFGGSFLNENLIDDVHFTSKWYQPLVVSDFYGSPLRVNLKEGEAFTLSYLSADLLFAKKRLCLSMDEQLMILTNDKCGFINKELVGSFPIGRLSWDQRMWKIDIGWGLKKVEEAILTFTRYGIAFGHKCEFVDDLKNSAMAGDLTVGGNRLENDTRYLGTFWNEYCDTYIGLDFYKQRGSKWVMFDLENKLLSLYRDSTVNN